MKKFNLFTFLILFFTFLGVQYIHADEPTGISSDNCLTFNSISSITPNSTLNINSYPCNNISFDAYYTSWSAIKQRIKITSNNNDNHTIELSRNSTNYNKSISTSATSITIKNDNGAITKKINNIKVQIAPHTKLNTKSLSFNTSLTDADGETQTVDFYSFLTGGSSMTISIVDADGNPTDIEGQVALVGTPGYEANKLGKINEEFFQIKFKPTKIVNATCSIKIENPGAEVNPTLYIPVTLKSSLPAPTLNCDAFGYTFAKLSWNTIDGANSYNLYDGNTKIGNYTTTNATISSLNYASSHSYTVTSVVGSAESNKSEAVTVNCPAYPTIKNITSSNVQTDKVTISWKQEDRIANHSYVEYIILVYENGSLKHETTTTNTSITLENLTNKKPHSVKVGVKYQYELDGTQIVSPNKEIENQWVSTSFTTKDPLTEAPYNESYNGIINYQGVWYYVNLNNDINITSNPMPIKSGYPCNYLTFKAFSEGAGAASVDNSVGVKEDDEHIYTTNKWSFSTAEQTGETKIKTTTSAISIFKNSGTTTEVSPLKVRNIWLTIEPHILLNESRYLKVLSLNATKTATSKAEINFGTIEVDYNQQININFKSFLSVGDIKASITEDNDNVFSLNDNKEEYYIAGDNTLEGTFSNDHSFTVAFNPKEAKEEYKGTIIIKDNNNIVEITLKGKCIKRTPEITWVNDKYISWGELLPDAAFSTCGIVRYELKDNNDNNIIAIDNSLNLLEGKGLGEAQIIAIVDEDEKWYSAKDTATFTVTDKIIQTIEWDQDLTTLKIGDEIELTAKAITRETGEENNNEIAYSTTDSTESVVKIVDGKLQVVGSGFAYITAHQQGNDEYAPTYMTKLLFVRELFGGGCQNHLALEDAEGKTWGNGDILSSGFNWGPFELVKELNTLGDKLSFTTTKITGQTFNTTGDYLIITDDLGNLVYNSNLGKTETNIQLPNPEAKKLTFTLGGNLKISISDIKVTPAKYITPEKNSIAFSITKVDSRNIEEIDFNWANQSDYAWATIIDDPEGVFSVDSKTAIFGSPTCGDYGTSTVKVIFSPKKGIDYTAKLAVYVGENIETPLLTIPITGKGAKAKQEIYWLNYPLTTADKEVNIANTTASSQQTITYTILSGNDIAVVNDNNTITILNEGKFTLRAVQKGNDSYLATETIEKEFTTNIGNLIFDNKIGNNNWNTIDNWKPDSRLNLYRNVTPEENINLSIAAPLVINNNTEIVTKNEISLSTNGRITIAPQGKLKANIINGTTTNNLTLQANDKGSAILVYNNTADNKVKASVQLYSIASSDGLRNGQPGNFKDPKWQYLGIVTEEVAFSTINPDGSSNWIFRWDETTNATSCWAEELSNGSTLSAWTGYCLAQEAANTYNYSGTLINGNHTYPLTYTPENASADLGNNLLTNSYTAPIDITTISDANFTNAEANIYIYNTGSYLEWKDQTELEGFNPGQIIVIPVNTISALGNEYPRTIASAQAFFVKATDSGASFAINYEENVFGSARKENVMRAKKMSDMSDMSDDSDQTFNSLKIQVTSSTSNDRLYLLEHENTTADFDNGYDAEKIFDNPNGPQIYASTAFGCSSINTDKSFDGQYIGFVANNENEPYTLSFDIENLHSYEQLWLYDTETELYVDILNQEEYQFYGTTTPNNNRFYVTSINPNAPEVDNTPTNTETTWEDILTEGKPIYLYTTTGQLVATLNAKLSTLNSKLTLNAQLPTGVYIVKSGNKTMKLRIIR